MDVLTVKKEFMYR